MCVCATKKFFLRSILLQKRGLACHASFALSDVIQPLVGPMPTDRRRHNDMSRKEETQSVATTPLGSRHSHPPPPPLASLLIGASAAWVRNAQTFAVHGRAFMPEFVSPTHELGAVTSPYFSTRKTARLGYCTEATVYHTIYHDTRITCRKAASVPPIVNVAAFDIFEDSFQHQIINAIPTFALTMALLDQMNITSNRTAIITSEVVRPLLSLRAELLERNCSLTLKNFVMAFPYPNPRDLKHWDTYPFVSYEPLRMQMPTRHSDDQILLISRRLTRTLDNASGLVAELAAHTGKRVVEENAERVIDWTRYKIIIAVHGGGQANMFKYARRTAMIEIVKQHDHRWCYGALATNLNLTYIPVSATLFAASWTSRIPVRVDLLAVLRAIDHVAL